MKKLLVVAILPLLISCQEKFNGKNEESFKISRDKIETKLNSNEKINLEKAMRVVAVEAMRLKWEEKEKYEGKHFNEISLELIDGLSYSGVVDLAETILKKRNNKEIDELTKEIDTLSIQKNEVLETQKKLNLFKIKSITIDKRAFFDEIVPVLEIDYQYIGKNKVIGTKTIQFELVKKSNNEILKSSINSYGDNESVLEINEVITENMILSQTKQTNPKLWNAQKYPIENPNLSVYDLDLKITVLSLVLNGKKNEMPKASLARIESEIKIKQEEIEQLKSIKGTLDKLELTDQ